MGMSLNSGGHLTHGYRHNLSSKLIRAVLYDVDPKTELLDYDSLAKQAAQEKPTILMAGYSAYPRKIDFAKMKEIADSVGAVLFVDMAHFAGLVAGEFSRENSTRFLMPISSLRPPIRRCADREAASFFAKARLPKRSIRAVLLF